MLPKRQTKEKRRSVRSSVLGEKILWENHFSYDGKEEWDGWLITFLSNSLD